MGDLSMRRVLADAITRYGEGHQMVVAMEELAELVQAICKHLRGEPDNIPEEIADVRIVLAQLEMMLECTEEVQDWMERKVDRLERRIKGGEDER